MPEQCKSQTSGRLLICETPMKYLSFCHKKQEPGFITKNG